MLFVLMVGFLGCYFIDAADSITKWRASALRKIFWSHPFKVLDAGFRGETLVVAVIDDRGRRDRLARDICLLLDLAAYPPRTAFPIRIIGAARRRGEERVIGGGDCTPPG